MATSENIELACHDGKKDRRRLLGDPVESEAFIRDLWQRGCFLSLILPEDGARMVRAADAIERLVREFSDQ